MNQGKHGRQFNKLFTEPSGSVDKNAAVSVYPVRGYFFAHNSIIQPAQKGNGFTLTDKRATNGQFAQNKLAVAGLTKRNCEARAIRITSGLRASIRK